MKKTLSLLTAAALCAGLLAGCGQAAAPAAPAESAKEAVTAEEAAPAEETGAVRQTATAWLMEDDYMVNVGVDLTGGWSVDFATGAVYLYDQPDTKDAPPVSMAVSLEKDVYEDYLAEYDQAENKRELDGALAYTSDGEEIYLVSVNDLACLMISVTMEGEAADAVFGRYFFEDAYATDQDSESDLFTFEDTAACTNLILNEFIGWKGCEMHELVYAGDDACSEENLQWLNSLKDGANYTQCMEFLSSFHSPTEEADLEGTAWEPDTEYKDYQWWLARSEGGEWELVTWGY